MITTIIIIIVMMMLMMIKHLPAHDELGMRRTSIVSPEQLQISIRSALTAG